MPSAQWRQSKRSAACAQPWPGRSGERVRRRALVLSCRWVQLLSMRLELATHAAACATHNHPHSRGGADSVTCTSCWLVSKEMHTMILRTPTVRNSTNCRVCWSRFASAATYISAVQYILLVLPDAQMVTRPPALFFAAGPLGTAAAGPVPAGTPCSFS